MLVVTENGIKLLLKQKNLPNIKLKDSLMVAILVAINCVFGLSLKSYSMSICIGINFIILIFSIGLQIYRKHNQPIMLSGGNLLLSPKTFIHTNLDKITQYQLTLNDTIETHGDGIQILNAHNKILYQINGFSEPKQLEVAQAVLQGKTIKTQGKAIKMQS